MFKRHVPFALAAGLIFQPWAAALADAAAPTSAGAPDLAAAKKDWDPVLKRLGIEEGKTATSERYDVLVRRLAELPPMAGKIRQSTRKPIALKDWIHILTGLGIEPKPAMTEADWAAILAKAGVDVSKGVSAPLPPVAKAAAPAAPPAVSTQTLKAVVPSAAPATAALASAPPPLAPAVPAMIAPSAPPPPIAPKTITKTVNLDLRGMDINEVLKLIARQGELNMVSASNVKGTVTLLLKDVELWEALHQVLETADLAYSYDGKVVRIMTGADYERVYGVRFDDKTGFETIIPKNIKAAAMSKFLEPFKTKIGKILVYDSANALVVIDTPDALKKMEQMAQTFDGQIETRVFSLNYAKVKEILPKILPMTTKDVATVESDERTNRIIVMDYPDRIKPMEALIKAFDEQHRVVLIEAKIIQVSLGDAYQLGVNWGSVFSSIGKNLGIPGGVTGSFAPFAITAPGTPAGGAGTAGPGAAGPTGITASIGAFGTNGYTAVVQALQTIGKTKLISSPRLSILNNETASLLVGTHQAYVTDTVVTPGAGATTTSEQVNFIDVGVKLHVTPSIGEDGFITMKIKPEVSAVDSTLTTAAGNSIPIVGTSEMETSVVVKDGETLLLGGLIQDGRTKTDNGVPILSKIPFLGALFRGRSDSTTKSELAIFLTCHLNNTAQREIGRLNDARMPGVMVTVPQ